MSSNINDYVRPTINTSRRDINAILEMIHDIVAAAPEDEGQKERICKTEHVKDRTTTVTFGGATVIDTDIRDRSPKVVRKKPPLQVASYDLIHTTVGTLTFPGKDSKLGAGAVFDGTAYITIDDNHKFNFEHTAPFTIAFWIKPNSSMTANATVIAKENAAGGDKGYFIFWTDATKKLTWGLVADAGADVISSALTEDIWTHVVMTYDGSSNRSGLKIYLGGILDVTGASLAITGTMINTLKFAIGAESDGGNKFTGSLAYLVVLNREVDSTWVTVI